MKKFLPGMFVFFLTALWYDAAMSSEVTSKDIRFVREIEGIREYEMPSNGLKILLMEDHSSPVATVMMTYLVGSRHETAEFRGGAHLLEHMMFKGTPSYNKANGNAVAHVLQRTGAFLNASTWKDGTNYYESLPSDKLALALEIEADRMRNSFIRTEDLVSEMPVVQSEFDRMENSPLTALDLAVWSTAFEKHAYHFPIIGIREDLEKMPASLLKKFYDTYYWPNNSILAVLGDFKTDSVLKLIQDKFGKISSPEQSPPEPAEKEPAQKQEKRVRIERKDQIDAVLIAHKVPETTHPDTHAMDVLSYVLSHGKTSRLYRALINRGLAVEANADNSKSFDPGLFTTEIILTPNARHEDIEKIVLAVYNEIKEKGISASELTRVKNQLHAEVAYSRDGSFSVAQQLSSAIAAGDWAFFTQYLEKLDTVTPGDVQKAAQKYLIPAGMTVGYLVSTQPAIPLNERETASFETAEDSESHSPPEPPAGKKMAKVKPTENLSHSKKISDRIQESSINGIRILGFQMGGNDVVTLMGSFEGAGQAFDENPLIPVLTASLLDEGTKNKNKFQIAKLLEDRGAKISWQIDHRRIGFHAQCLKKDIDLVVSLLAEEMAEPLFDKEEFLKQVEQQKVHLSYALADTSAQGSSALSRLIYPPTHPLYDIPIEEQLLLLEKITLDDIRSFHKNHYGIQNLLISAAGDFQFKDLETSVKKHFAHLPVRQVDAAYTPLSLRDVKKTSMEISIKDKVKIDAYFGHGLPLTRSSLDYLPLYLANAVLGADFAARLTNTVRDDQGLTYHVHSEIHGLEKDTEGHWEINIILNRAVLKQGVHATLSEIKKFVRGGITEKELADKKETIAGKFLVSFSTTGGTARQILRNAELGFQNTYLDQFPDLIKSLTLDEVNNAIQKYFHPDRLHTVISGTSE